MVLREINNIIVLLTIVHFEVIEVVIIGIISFKIESITIIVEFCNTDNLLKNGISLTNK